ncbi:MAG: hypothetical protein NC299_17350 [Lachnospiraceae bacterium]|nr:hypothetical protein [Ruminococcus sp.]MCM1277098.1 hypothetical protein [Lachnospiraceae bacterium]
MKYQIKCAESEQKSMFYSNCEPALRNACVGHVRMDFGSGNEFYTTWWGNRVDLNTEPFRAELDDVVNAFRKDGLLKNRSEMYRICCENKSLPLDGSYGFSVETDDHLFLLRCRLLPLVGGILAADFVAAATTSCCRPERGNYDCYMYCYNKRELQLAQSQDESQSPGMSL